jgi:hypothetical protein
MMEPYRPLRLIFFIFDFIRLMVMISLLMAFVPPAGSEGSGVFPYIFYTVPNGLFPLISFFLLFRLNAYKPYVALYMAGKILAVVAIFAWLIFSLPHIRGTLLAVSGDAFTIIGTILFLSVGDVFTVLGGAILQKKILNMGILVPEEG